MLFSILLNQMKSAQNSVNESVVVYKLAYKITTFDFVSEILK